ncbi:anti-sigma factor [Serratia sp. M24T3]|uniref:anti-sigma factor family protein n=1 Tax=Serratia sp. M24T3 TaxID=932213 RepID=UPI00025BAF1C|nr:anti-sigma factor [Serratia sp. M24T3]EIC85680.1 transmembrane anti-sigma factor [Serratia sp. M24T3]
MTDNFSFSPVNDTLLVAYLDNELDAEQRIKLEQRLQHDEALSARLEALAHSQLDFSGAFEPLLAQAPVASLQKNLDALSDKKAPDSSRDGVTRRSLLAAAIGLVAIGMGVERYALSPSQNTVDDGWRNLVAQYMSLYSAETLADINDSPAEQKQELDRVAREVGIGLSPAQLKLSGAQLKNARILRYDEYNIAQISWLDEQFGPLALCITRSDKSNDQAQAAEVRRGMNVVYWRRNGYNFMLIGRAPAKNIQQQGLELLNNIS